MSEVNCTAAVEQLIADTARIVSCRPTGRRGSLILTTTSLYSDRDHVQVIVEDLGPQVRVSDGGLTLMRLDMHGAPIHTKGHQQRMERIMSAYGVRLLNDVIETMVDPNHLSSAVASVSSAAVQVDTLIHEDPRERQTFASQVESWLHDRTDYSITKAKIPGHSYPVLRVDTRHNVFVAPVAGGKTRVQAIQVAGWRMEAGESLTPAQRVMLLHGRVDQYPSEEIERILGFATVASWPERPLLLDHLRGADREEWQPERRLLTAQESL